MSKIKVSELFGPNGFWEYHVDGDEHLPVFNQRYGVTQGEGKFVGQRSVFLRTFGCNLKCPSFGLPAGEKTNEPQEFAKNIGLYKSISDVPAAQFGCDSYYSVYPEFKSLSPMLDVEVLAEQILMAAGESMFRGCNPIHLILTGGEPMLGWQKSYVDLVKHLQSIDPIWSANRDFKLPMTIETNGTKPIVSNYMHQLSKLCDITWSISPKLSVSGHSPAEAIFPDVIASYKAVSSDMYLKFVVQDIADFDEVDHVVSDFRDVGVFCNVFIMPEGGTVDEFRKHATLDLVGEAVKRGYNITTRLQVMIGSNVVGW